jgi:hypothetical protein
MPEALFLERSGRFKDSRYQSGHFGIVRIKFNYKEHSSRHGSITLVSNDTVFVTFVHEWLAMLFQADLDGYMGGDLQRWRRYAFNLVQLANVEMNKLRSHVRARRCQDRGCPRWD